MRALAVLRSLPRTAQCNAVVPSGSAPAHPSQAIRSPTAIWRKFPSERGFAFGRNGFLIRPFPRVNVKPLICPAWRWIMATYATPSAATPRAQLPGLPERGSGCSDRVVSVFRRCAAARGPSRQSAAERGYRRPADLVRPAGQNSGHHRRTRDLSDLDDLARWQAGGGGTERSADAESRYLGIRQRGRQRDPVDVRSGMGCLPDLVGRWQPDRVHLEPQRRVQPLREVRDGRGKRAVALRIDGRKGTHQLVAGRKVSDLLQPRPAYTLASAGGLRPAGPATGAAGRSAI